MAEYETIRTATGARAAQIDEGLRAGAGGVLNVPGGVVSGRSQIETLEVDAVGDIESGAGGELHLCQRSSQC